MKSSDLNLHWDSSIAPSFFETFQHFRMSFSQKDSNEHRKNFPRPFRFRSRAMLLSDLHTPQPRWALSETLQLRLQHGDRVRNEKFGHNNSMPHLQ